MDRDSFFPTTQQARKFARERDPYPLFSDEVLSAINSSDFIQDENPKKQKFERQNIDPSNSTLLNMVETTINLCTNFGELGGIRTLDKATESDSVQVLGIVNQKKVFLKIFNDQSLKKDNSLLVEAAIYFCVIAKLIPKHCPFFIQPIAYQECDGFLNRLARESGNPLSTFNKTQIEKILSVFDDQTAKTLAKQDVPNYRQFIHSKLERSYIIINEQLNIGGPLLPYEVDMTSWFSFPQSLESYKQVLFQLIWTLWCMKIIRLRHNDLHTSNAYVRTLEKPKRYSFFYYYDGNFYDISFESKYEVLVFDFDRATIVGLTSNSGLQGLCNGGYGCESPNFGFDFAQVFCYIRRQVGKVYTVKFGDKAVYETFSFLTQFSIIQGEDLKNVFAKFCTLPPKNILTQFPRLAKLEYVGNELKIEYDYGNILSKDPYFESLRVKKQKLFDESVTFTLPDEAVKKDIEDSIRTNFSSILYRGSDLQTI